MLGSRPGEQAVWWVPVDIAKSTAPPRVGEAADLDRVCDSAVEHTVINVERVGLHVARPPGYEPKRTVPASAFAVGLTSCRVLLSTQSWHPFRRVIARKCH